LHLVYQSKRSERLPKKMNKNLDDKHIYLSPPHMSGLELEYIKKVFETNYIAPLGPMVDAFEAEFSKKTGINYSLAVSSGTAALHLALRVIGVEAGDEVIASTLTFIGSITPIIFQGARPVFIDSNPESWNMDVDLLAEDIEMSRQRGKLPKAVIPTDLYGQCADMDRILEICEPYDIPVISDSAESLGSIYKDRSAGTGAKAAIFSFNGNKIVNTSGGGMLVSDDKELIYTARFLSQQARDDAPHYEHSQIGYNYRMSNVLAAIGMAQLKILDERVEAKRRIFNYYKDALGEIKGIEFMPEVSYGRSNRWLTVILITPEEFGVDRETIRLTLEDNGIESRPVWKPMHIQPVFEGCRIRGGMVSEDFFARGLCLPSGTAMTDNDLDRIISVILDCMG
jgi:dTDP-4-amino-4,6-dideoxygalactose transaminase